MGHAFQPASSHAPRGLVATRERWQLLLTAGALACVALALLPSRLVLLAFALMCATALVAELLDRAQSTEEWALSLPPVPLAANLPVLTRAQRRASELVVETGACPMYTEGLRALAIAIEGELPPHGGGRVLALTSALPSEGKTLTLANLALCLAEAGHRVLVVDGDLHRPRLHKVFGQPMTNQGLCEVLSERLYPREATYSLGQVDLVRGGKARLREPIASLKRQWAPTLEAWRESYDYVLVDLPPLPMFANVAYMARHVDGMLVVTRRRASRLALPLALRQLQSVHAPLLGVVSIAGRASLREYRHYLVSGT